MHAQRGGKDAPQHTRTRTPTHWSPRRARTVLRPPACAESAPHEPHKPFHWWLQRRDYTRTHTTISSTHAHKNATLSLNRARAKNFRTRTATTPRHTTAHALRRLGFAGGKCYLLVPPNGPSEPLCERWRHAPCLPRAGPRLATATNEACASLTCIYREQRKGFGPKSAPI